MRTTLLWLGCYLGCWTGCGGAQVASGPREIPEPLAERCDREVASLAAATESGKHVPVAVLSRAGGAAVPEAELAQRLTDGAAGARSWVLARGGAGKSHLAWALHAQSCGKVATVRLEAARDLRPLMALARPGRPALAQALAAQLGNPRAAEPVELVQGQLGQQKWLLIVDGTDELSSRERRQLDDELAWLLRQEGLRPHLVRLERPGAEEAPSKRQAGDAVYDLPELSCADVDGIWQRRFAEPELRGKSLAWRDKYGLGRQLKTGGCQYVSMATWRDVQLVADLANDAQQGQDDLPTRPTRADLYSAWASHRLFPAAENTQAAMSWLDRIVAWGVLQADEPDLQFSVDRCNAVPTPGSRPHGEACPTLLKSSVMRAGESATTWLLVHQGLADLLLARWLVARKPDCLGLADAVQSVGSLEVTAMVVAQPAGRRCLTQMTLAACSAGVAPRRLARFYEEALAGDADVVARAAADASTPCEREVFAALQP